MVFACDVFFADFVAAAAHSLVCCVICSVMNLNLDSNSNNSNYTQKSIVRKGLRCFVCFAFLLFLTVFKK